VVDRTAAGGGARAIAEPEQLRIEPVRAVHAALGRRAAARRPAEEELEGQRGAIEAITGVLEQFNIDAAVTGFTRGPTVTRYEIELGPAVKVEKITALTKNMAYAVANDNIRHPGADPRQVRRRRRGAQHRPRDGEPRRRAALPGGQAGPHPMLVGLGKDIEGGFVCANLQDAAPAGRRCHRCR
jgi:S-DNA-T family DNA segregation ATPase FtsK/SpoIIIE